MLGGNSSRQVHQTKHFRLQVLIGLPEGLKDKTSLNGRKCLFKIEIIVTHGNLAFIRVRYSIEAVKLAKTKNPPNIFVATLVTELF